MRYAVVFAAGAGVALFIRHAHRELVVAKRERKAWNMYRPAL